MFCVTLRCAACSTPFLWSCPKKRGGAPKKNAFGWWRPREVSGPTRLSHSRGRCHSAAKVSASRTDWITRRRGEGLGLVENWRLKVFCPAFLQKSGRGPGAAPLGRAPQRAERPLCFTKRRKGLKGEPSPGVPPLRARMQGGRWTYVRTGFRYRQEAGLPHAHGVRRAGCEKNFQLNTSVTSLRFFV